MIEVENLTRSYGSVVAVDDVSFGIGRGEVVGLLGHNGAGKTTIMKTMCGYLEPTLGAIRIDGLDVATQGRAVRARIGYLPENCPVWPEMTVIDYLDYLAALHELPLGERSAAVADAIRRTALKEKADAVIQTLSRGYRQRVGVAQALLHRPDILILDEPTNGLDPTQILHMRELIRDLARSATVIVSTHILQEVQAVCQRVLILRGGRLVVDSRLDALQGDGGLLVSVEGEAQALLETVAGVRMVRERAATAGRHNYFVQAPLDAAPAVARALAHAGVALYALQPQRRDLEAVFAEINDEAVHV